MTINCSSFVYYSWKSLFLQNILKGLRDRPVLQNTDLCIISLSHHFEKEIYQYVNINQLAKKNTLHKKWSFLWRISSVKLRKLRIWSHLLKKSLMENFIFCAVTPIFKNTSLWLLLTGKHLCWSLFLILSIAKFLRAPILKNICERVLLKTCSWNWVKLKFIHNFTLKTGFFFDIRKKWICLFLFHDWIPMKFVSHTIFLWRGEK